MSPPERQEPPWQAAQVITNAHDVQGQSSAWAAEAACRAYAVAVWLDYIDRCDGLTLEALAAPLKQLAWQSAIWAARALELAEVS